MKTITTLLLISFLALQTMQAQDNTTAYERRPFQFTFLFPPLSTNGARNAQIVNDVSLNLFLGVSGGVEAFEAASFINIDQYYVHGAQLAGFGNTVGGSAYGAQVAGFMNIAGNVKGAQIAGFLNVCDSIDGVPLAFISVVKKNGYRRIGFTASEVQYANLSFKMGVKQLYTIYSFGKPMGPLSRWMFGGGLGAEFDLSEKMVFNIEGTVHQELWIGSTASPYFLHIDRLNLYNSLKFLFGWNMDERVAIHLGPTFNVSVADSNPAIGQMAWNEIGPYSFYNRTSSNYEQTNVQMWVGLQGSIHF